MPKDPSRGKRFRGTGPGRTPAAGASLEKRAWLGKQIRRDPRPGQERKSRGSAGLWLVGCGLGGEKVFREAELGSGTTYTSLTGGGAGKKREVEKENPSHKRI